MYNITALLTAAFASSAASPAAAQEPSGFDYRTRLLPSGAIAIEGRRLADDGAFDVRIDVNGLVTGDVAGSRIRFWVSAAAHRRLAARLAGNPAARLVA